MNRNFLYIIVLCFFAKLTWATDNLRLPDTRTLGLGGNGVSLSAFFNPSLLALQTQKELRADYFNRYSISELSTVSGGFVCPNNALPFGLHIASFGYDEYRESMFRFSVGKQLNDAWSLGVAVQYAMVQSELFENDPSRLAVDIGVTLHPVDNWLIALSIMNFPSVGLSEKEADNEQIAERMVSLGFNMLPMNGLLITAGVENTEETPFSLSVGAEYEAIPEFKMRVGVQTNPFRPSLGVGYALAGLTADVVLWYHPVLGASTGIGLSFSF